MLARSTPLIPTFWLDGFRPEGSVDVELSEDDKSRVSPIYRAFGKNDGIGAIQWIKATHDAAAVVVAEDSWVHGGDFRLWISPGAGRMPYEVPLTPRVTIPAEQNDNVEHLLGEALNLAGALIGAN